MVSATGALDLTALSAINRFSINLWSLSATSPGDINGDISGFDATHSSSWTLLNAAGGITGFSSDKFLVNVNAINGTGGFSNGLAGGNFSIQQSGNSLNLVYSAVPEPGSALGTVGLIAGGLLLRRRQNPQGKPFHAA